MSIQSITPQNIPHAQKTSSCCCKCPKLGIVLKVTIITLPICATLGLIFNPVVGVISFSAVILTTMLCMCVHSRKKNPKYKELAKEINKVFKQIHSTKNQNETHYKSDDFLKIAKKLNFNQPFYKILLELEEKLQNTNASDQYTNKTLTHLKEFYLRKVLIDKGYSKEKAAEITEIAGKQEDPFECTVIGTRYCSVLELIEADIALIDPNHGHIFDIHEFTLYFLKDKKNLATNQQEIEQEIFDQILNYYNLTNDDWLNISFPKVKIQPNVIQRFLKVLKTKAQDKYKVITKGQEKGLYPN